MIEYVNYGGADGVTGSCHMINTDFGNILLDCGLFQGRDKDIYSNLDMYFNPRNVDAVILSHAHIDHCGRIPILYGMGYKGKVYGTEATKLLCEIVLEESSRIFKELSGDVYRLFTLDNVKMFLNNYVSLNYREEIEILKNVFVELFDAGHLLGSASVLVKVEDKTIFYSGDIGKLNTPILKDPEKISGANYLIFESTYGSLEEHDSNNFIDEFREIVINTLKRGGRCIIPSSTLGKMQEILYLLNEIFENENSKYKVYIDSPMSTKIIDVYEKCRNLYDSSTMKKLDKGDNPFKFTNLRYVTTTEQSIDIQNSDEPYVVLSAGGMCEGGRVIYHLRKQIGNSKSSIILVGNQAKGTLGSRLANGNSEIKIFRGRFKVRAEVHNFPSLSGHGDRRTLVDYINSMKQEPNKIFLVHGDRKNQIDLRNNLRFKEVEHTKFLKRYVLK